MKHHQRNLLAIALIAALASPLAIAQSVTGQVTGTVTGTVEGTTQLPTATVESTVQRTTDTASDAVQDTTQTVDRTVQESDASVAADAQVTGHAKAGQEGNANQGFAPPAIWATLDANADGHIDAKEASADAGFEQNFAAIDTNDDGVVSKAEFRVERTDESDDRQY